MLVQVRNYCTRHAGKFTTHFSLFPPLFLSLSLEDHLRTIVQSPSSQEFHLVHYRKCPCPHMCCMKKKKNHWTACCCACVRRKIRLDFSLSVLKQNYRAKNIQHRITTIIVDLFSTHTVACETVSSRTLSVANTSFHEFPDYPVLSALPHWMTLSVFGNVSMRAVVKRGMCSQPYNIFRSVYRSIWFECYSKKDSGSAETLNISSWHCALNWWNIKKNQCEKNNGKYSVAFEWKKKYIEEILVCVQTNR